MSNPPSDRQQRLAQALRANLRRRKGQARSRPDEAVEPATGTEADQPDAAGDCSAD